MATLIDKLQEAYRLKPKRIKTWSGIPLKEKYTPEDIKGINYITDIAEPGEYPFTRGIYPDMYRGKVWTTREITGHSSPAETNKRLKFLIDAGESGLNVIGDEPTMGRLDGDHPMAIAEVGIEGVPITSLKDIEVMMDGIPLDKVSMTLTFCSPPIWAQYVALAEIQGYNLATLRGTFLNCPLSREYYWGGETFFPTGCTLKLAMDTAEFAIRNMPLWNPISAEGYDIREGGVNAPQELAFVFGCALTYVDELLKRGLDIDQIGPKIAFTMSAHIDLFEEACKFRAARRMWARMIKEKYGAKEPRSMRFRFHVNTAGCLSTLQQPLNNIVRYAYASLAAILGGAQSLHTTSYNEPICIPTEEAHRIAVRTQQILAYEVGATNVADPLGGSYYVEWLTNKIKGETEKILNEIDKRGGFLQALKSGWVDQEYDKAALEYQKEVEEKERIIVGVNAFTIPEEEEEGKIHRVVTEEAKKYIEGIKELKRTRDKKKWRAALLKLREDAEKKDMNLFPVMIEAAKAYATVGEVMGTIRQAYGHSYDPLGMVESPLK